MKIQLSKDQQLIAFGAGVLVSMLCIFLFFFKPFSERLQVKRDNYEMVRAKLALAQYQVATLRNSDKSRNFVSVERVSSAVDELTKRGKSIGINFVSITPQAIENIEDGTKRLPIEMEVESNYQSLGTFLGVLDDLEKSLLTVRGFELKYNEIEPLKLKMKLSVEIHIIG